MKKSYASPVKAGKIEGPAFLQELRIDARRKKFIASKLPRASPRSQVAGWFWRWNTQVPIRQKKS
jgi:hypothetical protein